MNLHKLLFVSFILLSVSAKAQVVYTCEYKSDAKVKVYIAAYKSDADLVVYKCDYKSDASGNKGLWYFAKYKSDADKTIYLPNTKAMLIW